MTGRLGIIIRACALSGAILACLIFGGAASAEELRADYSATIRGIPVGSAKLRATVEGDRYAIRLSAKVGGLARLFSDMETSLSVVGKVGPAGLAPESYQHSWREDDDAETARITFQAGSVSDVVVDPPPRRPERRVPMGPGDLTDVLDLGSALIWTGGREDDVSLCSRTLALFDGTQRFDLALSFDRFADFETRDGSFSGRATVCAMRYHPISGYRRDKEEIAFMAANEDMEMWMAPVGGGLAIPVKIRLRTEHGFFNLEARQFGSDD